jgi:hypothetical protein
MWDAPAPLFPDWFPARDIERSFDIVQSGGEVVITTVGYFTSEEELAQVELCRTGRPLCVIYPLDDLAEPSSGGWLRSDQWSAMIRDFALSADVLAGPQLPADLDHPCCLPLPYGPLTRLAPPPSRAELRDRMNDVYFSGAWQPPTRTVGLSPRSREFRGHLVSQLASAPRLRAAVDKVHYWRTNPRQPGVPLDSNQEGAAPDKESLLLAHEQCLRDSRLALAPPGHAHYTARHSDVLASGGGLLTCDVTGRVRVPEPDLWHEEIICFSFSEDGTDLIPSAHAALADLDRLARTISNARKYAAEYLDPRRQVTRLAALIAGMLR